MKSQSAVAALVSLFILAIGISRATVPDKPRKIVVLSEGFLAEPRASHQTPYSLNFKLLDGFVEAIIDCRLIDASNRVDREVRSVRIVPAKDQLLNAVLNVPFSVAGKYELFVVIRTVDARLDARRDSDVIHVSHVYIELADNGAKTFAKPPEDFGKRIISNNSTLKTATLTHLQPRSYATDKLQIVQSIVGSALTTPLDDNWAWADFPMTYDPTFTANSQGAWLDFTTIGGGQNETINDPECLRVIEHHLLQ